MGIQGQRFSDPQLQDRLENFLKDDSARIRKIEHDGVCYWAKKSETLSLRWRIQKGDPMVAFKADLDGMHALSEAGIPVAQIAVKGPNYVVTADSGPTLAQMLVSKEYTNEQRIAAFTAAGRELADMHQKGLSHGRPAIKDMCWDGKSLVFLDFERFSAKRNNARGHMLDLIIAVHSTYATLARHSAEAAAFEESYRLHDQTGTWQRAKQFCHKIRWLDTLTKPLQWGNRVGAAEFKAIPLTLAAFQAG